MDKKELQRRFESPFDARAWNEVLVSVFGVRKLHTHPKPVSLASNSISRSAVELGFLTTSDDRIIGLYTIDILKGVRLERSKVQLRELIRNIYKYDVDGAIVIFNQEDNWRLSFISEIRVINEDGSVETKTTEPKRFTYLLGRGTKAKTPGDRLSILSGRRLSLDDLRAAFSVEALNKEFYQKVAEQFYELVGATTGKGKKLISREAVLALPGVSRDTPENKRSRQEFAVRLIGRIIFCWFLKVKRSDQQIPLLPDSLLSSESARKTKNYYHGVLEPLFFQVLNRPVEDRISDLPDAADSIPFLNGGLFEAQTEDFYNAESVTGNFANYALKIPDDWFIALFEKLEQYNFTIDENSPTEIEVSVDPEMLGRIFENLLAEIDPDSGESARKSTGSFYTPREIVNYMVDESLILYLKDKLSEGDGGRADEDLERSLRKLFSYRDSQNPFKPKQTRQLIDAIDQCKILDPACGSGAFLMGALQRLVHLLGKLDPENQYWKEKQLVKLDDLIESAGAIDAPKVRKKVVSDLNKRRRDIDSDFAKKELDYGRKLFLIENGIHGVDIQPIAAEISKLRCFLTLIVDDSVNDKELNRGVNPLPNLEFKFVTADALLELPASGLFNSDGQLKKLEAVRHEYINSYGTTKETAKHNFQKIQDEIFDQQIRNFNDNQDRRAIALSTWNPFGHEKVDWFDPEWMFGVKGFDIVIGNPPYVEFKNLAKQVKALLTGYRTTKGKYDLYIPFLEQPSRLLKKSGILCYICPTRFMHRDYGAEVRKFIASNYEIAQIVDFGDRQMFETATTYTGVFIFKNAVRSDYTFYYANELTRNEPLSVSSTKLLEGPWYFENESIEGLISSIREKTRALESISEGILQGIATGKDSVFLVKENIIREYEIERDILKPFLMGKDIRRYAIEWSGNYCIYPYNDFGKVIPEADFKTKYPKAYRYLTNRKAELSGRDYFERSSKLWFELWNQRTITKFKKRKIVTLDNASRNSFAIDDGKFIGTTTTYSIIIPDDSFGLEFVTALLNSRLLTYYHQKNTIPQASGFFRYQATFIKGFPIKVAEAHIQDTFKNLVDYLLFLREADVNVSEHVSNSHLTEQFDEVIDALVYELYFEKYFRQADIAFHKYAARDFNPIEGLDNKDKLKVIETAYQKLREKNSEIRNNLKLMDIRLADLIGPIKKAR